MAKSDKTRQLRVAQQTAIELLLAGKTDQEVAVAVGVTRQTVTLWRNKDELFRAALDARRREIWGAHVERLRQLVARALQILEDDLGQDEDRRLRQSAAVHVLKCVGLYGANLEPKEPSVWSPFHSWSDARLEKALKHFWAERGDRSELGNNAD
ncbi:MAG: helix-turn-helix domain-containing protein [Thermogutta sp.]|mgnify:CR=1 FL=1|jgi:AcrR family transcriptional regulator